MAGVFPPEQHLVFTVIAAVLHLGNVQFRASGADEKHDAAVLTDMVVVNWVAYLLQVMC